MDSIYQLTSIDHEVLYCRTVLDRTRHPPLLIVSALGTPAAGIRYRTGDVFSCRGPGPRILRILNDTD